MEHVCIGNNAMLALIMPISYNRKARAIKWYGCKNIYSSGK
jgi:hypothetical protein